MKEKRGFQIAQITLCVLFLLCLILPMFKIDLSYITGRLSDIFADSGLDILEDGKSMRIFDVVKEVANLNDDIKKMATLYQIAVFLPHVLNLAILVLAFFRNKKTLIASIVLSVIAAIEMPIMHLLIMPARIKSYTQEVIDGSLTGQVISWLNPNLSSEAGDQLADIYRGSLTIGFWISLMIMVLICVICALSYVDMIRNAGGQTVTPVPKRVKPVEKKQGLIRDICGIYQYAEIPIEGSETVVIGRNPEMCNVIVQGEKVSRKHCSISFDTRTGQYRIQDHSSNGTFISGRGRMKKESVEMVPAGTRISLGEKDNDYFQLG